jgi:hypothetical protein
MKRFLVLVAVLIPVAANGQSWRPCGGDNSDGNPLIPQGWRGADFRPACAKHDAYYNNKNSPVSRAQADWIFLNDMLEQSKYSSRPIQARIVARNMYRAVRVFGRRGYKK